jgi:asparagine synthase (glutamine-hydrolysing)
MCGLSGFAGRGNRDDLERATRALRHRGPDGEGFFIDPTTGVHLGHRRLAILDLAGGGQPMWNEDRTVAVVHNGEIYNHLELRHQLIARGHHFTSDHSDTEVLVHGYEEWGTDLPARLNGMFAFAILDRSNRRLFLARDRFGEKPLYYAHRPGVFAFASELTALCRLPFIERQIRPDAIQKFLAYGFLPSPHTLMEGVYKLPGGSWLRFDLDQDRVRTERFWRFSLEPDDRLDETHDDVLAEELRELIGQAVRRRLIADVPLGLFLSGGVDSGAILAAAARSLPADQIRTFTIGFSEPSFDESDYAALVAKTFGTQHATDRLDLETARELIPAVLGALDEPLGDPSILPTYLLSRFTRREVTVALSGDGGDELFAGYDPFAALALAQTYHRLVPSGVHRLLRDLAELLPLSDRNMSLDFKVRRALAGLSYPASMWNPAWLAPVEPDAMASLCDRPLAPEELYSEAIGQWDRAQPHLSLIDRTLEFYTTFYLPDNILTKVDRASMMSSLESRAVFLDNDLVAFCQRLPHRFKYRNGTRKYLLKRALEHDLPADILRRPKKGFGIPLVKWLRSEPAVLPLDPVPGIRMDRVRQAWIEHREGRRDHRLFLWSWLSLQSALRSYLGRSDAA